MVDSVINRLAQVELFSALSEDDLEAVADLAQAKAYPRGALLFKQGERGHAGYLVERGELRVVRVDSDGAEEEVTRLVPGDFFGESSLLLAEPHDATVEVTQDSVLYVVEKEPFDALLAAHPRILDNLQMSPRVEERRRAPRFDWQEPDEVTTLVLRKHDFILAERLITPAVLLVLVIAGVYAWGTTSPAGLILGGAGVAAALLLGLYYVVDHLNDRYVLTNRRIVHDEQVFLIHRSRIGARLSNIQSIQLVQNGVTAKTFDYGDLLIETAGEPGGVITFRKIPHPSTIQREIFEQIKRAEAWVRAEERTAIRDALYRRLQGNPSEEQPPETKEPEPAAEADTPSRWSTVAAAPLQLVQYFFPPLRIEQGDVVTWRKHWVALLGPIARPTLAIALVTLAAGWFLERDGHRLSMLLSYGIVLLFLVPWWLWVFEDWQNEIYQVTPARIIDIERRPLGLREERREASLAMVQNVSLRMPGLVGRLLGYGFVTIETAGAGAFTFDYVKDPQDVQAEIFRYIEAFEERERERQAERHREELLEWFTVYDRMRHPEDHPRGDGVARPPSDARDPTDPPSS
ncbi:MAG: cyclic nucleotide-binding domain-containing protein [Chloroflexota bacterium]